MVAYANSIEQPKTGINEELILAIDKFWKGSILEGKGRLLVDECSRSSVPRKCVKVIAAQTWYETKFGTLGSGKPPRRNLTGIRDKKGDVYVYRSYKKYNESIVDTVNTFIDKNYQDYFTLYGFENGLCKSLNRWGTKHCGEIKDIISKM